MLKCKRNTKSKVDSSSTNPAALYHEKNTLSLFCCLFLIFCYIITAVLILPPSSPSSHRTPCSQQSIPMLLSMSMGHSYMVFDWSFWLLPTIIPLPSPLVTVRLCRVSLLSLPVVLLCSLVYFVH